MSSRNTSLCLAIMIFIFLSSFENTYIVGLEYFYDIYIIDSSLDDLISVAVQITDEDIRASQFKTYQRKKKRALAQISFWLADIYLGPI